MYKIIGGDHKEYGPVSTEQLREWIAQGRANGQTQVWVEATGQWQPLASIAELAAGLPPPPVVPPAPPPRLSQSRADALAAEILARDYDLRIGDCFSRGWQLLKKHFWLLVGATALIAILQTAADFIPPGGVIGIALVFAFWSGLDWLYLKLLRGQPATVEDAFAGFKLAFVPLLLASIVCFVLLVVGFFLLVLPFIYLSVCYLPFVGLLILDKQLDFWPAMELSRKVVTKHWWKVFGLVLLSCVVALAGVLVCGVGFFVTLPLAQAATVYAYEDIFGARNPEPAPPATPVTA